MMTIKTSAYRPLRQFASEYLVAAWREKEGGRPMYVGGGHRGWDIEDDGMLINAAVLAPTSASERRTWPGHDWKLTRHRHRPYDPEETSHIALVAFPEEMAFEASDRGGRFSIIASSQGTAIYLVTTDELNTLLDPGGPWRVLPLETRWMERHRAA